jgi:peptidase E
MPAEHPTILATSGGYTTPARGDLALNDLVHHAVELARPTGQPRLCHLGTASGDQRFRNAMVSEAAVRAGYAATHLNLFPMPNVPDIEEHLLQQDVVWVNGGSVVNLLAVWRAHGLEPILRRAWEAGVVLAGISAGSICWYQGGVTDSFGPDLAPVTDALGFLPFANGVHYDTEPGRRPLVHRLVGDGTLPTAHCTDDGVGLVYHGQRLVEAVSETDDVHAWVVRREGGDVVEERVEPRRLPSVG